MLTQHYRFAGIHERQTFWDPDMGPTHALGAKPALPVRWLVQYSQVSSPVPAAKTTSPVMAAVRVA